jgi:hypothetical protein
MHTLDEIYNAVTSVSPSISQREGYSKFHNCEPLTTTTILAVPTGRRFVLRKLHVSINAPHWSINGGPNVHIDSSIAEATYTMAPGGSETMYEFIPDFPDGCVVVEGPNDLTLTNTHGSYTIKTHFIGYFYDVP